MISERSKLSLCQFLSLQPQDFQKLMLRKHDIYEDIRTLDRLVATVEEAQPSQIHGLLSEITRTQGDLRTRVAPRYRYDERWRDLKLCLRLDGYIVKNDQLVAVDPTIEGAEPLDDDLTALLRASDLPEADSVLGMLDSSTEAFRRVPPDVNDCLTKARVALQTTARVIASVRYQSHPRNYDESSWGEVLSYLRTSDFVTREEEKGLAGVFRFVSPGAHRPIEPDELEMARLGRSLSIGMLYFLVKRYMENE